MRKSISACALCALVAGAAAADERTDPTTFAPSPPSVTRAPDPCDVDLRCRIDRFRNQQARRRRQEYLLRVAEAAAEMDERIERASPMRTRFAYEVDLFATSNLTLPGLLLGYAPTWWLKLEAFVGRYQHGRSGYDDAMNYIDNNVEGVVAGTQLRILPIKWLLSPYASAGWAVMSGRITDQAGANAQAVAHLVGLGLGLELVAPWFHVSLGYQLEHSFYTQALVVYMHDDMLRGELQKTLDDNHHGVSFEIGSVF